jgi:hypothetical protein
MHGAPQLLFENRTCYFSNRYKQNSFTNITNKHVIILFGISRNGINGTIGTIDISNILRLCIKSLIACRSKM